MYWLITLTVLPFWVYGICQYWPTQSLRPHSGIFLYSPPLVRYRLSIYRECRLLPSCFIGQPPFYWLRIILLHCANLFYFHQVDLHFCHFSYCSQHFPGKFPLPWLFGSLLVRSTTFLGVPCFVILWGSLNFIWAPCACVMLLIWYELLKSCNLSRHAAVCCLVTVTLGGLIQSLTLATPGQVTKL